MQEIKGEGGRGRRQACELRGPENVNLQRNRIVFKLEADDAAFNSIAGMYTGLFVKLPQSRSMNCLS
jgi:hypothetical protein